ncbi:asialoglycoprotein receptor 1-like [Polypterus senegalus]|uniref:asialoglycoprotein receptor 1-like n=1 Tax=Polypterus senegalus TaxID=55291 RepID=UPI001962B921|nr:asialoglycoprotein receptor 1-like [Polypterus senegalus]
MAVQLSSPGHKNVKEVQWLRSSGWSRYSLRERGEESEPLVSTEDIIYADVKIAKPLNQQQQSPTGVVKYLSHGTYNAARFVKGVSERMLKRCDRFSWCLAAASAGQLCLWVTKRIEECHDYSTVVRKKAENEKQSNDGQSKVFPCNDKQRLWLLKLLVILLCCVVLVVTFSLIVYYVTGNKYKENEDRLELSISTIKEKLDLLQANFTHLQNQSSALNESYSELLSQNDELKTNHSELLSRYSSLYENFTELTLRFTALDDYCPIANNITNERKCAVCPKDWLLFNKMCYLFSTVTKTWNKSRDYCASLKGHLVIIENAEEQRFLINTTKSKEGPYWIGLTDQEIEGHFVWVNNGSLDGNNSFWGQREHDNGFEPDNWTGDGNGGEDCVQLQVNQKYNGWYDAACSKKEKMICEANIGDLQQARRRPK